MRHSFNGNFPVTRAFGIKDPAYAGYPDSRHPGTDYGLPAKTPTTGTPLVAGMSGQVTAINRDSSIHTGRGKEVVITNGNKQRKTCHMNRIDVTTGQLVKEGQPIGLSGYTGYVIDAQGNIGTPGGAHLHDELMIDGKYVDLEKYLKEGAGMAWSDGNRLDFIGETHGLNETTKNFYKNQVGKDMQTAWYAIKDTLEYRSWQFFNTGDFVNIVGKEPDQPAKDFFKFKADGTSHVTHKDAMYWLKANGYFNGNFKLYSPPQLYVQED